MDVRQTRALPPVFILAAGGVVAAASGVVDAAGLGGPSLCTDAKPVALRAQVAQVAPQVSRMASRFSQLAVLGAADCLRWLEGGLNDQLKNLLKKEPDSALDANARIYLATGLGDVAHTDALYFGVMPPRSEMPPPARFATSGNNMAAFFVAQRAGLTARNLTLSHAELSFEFALELALSDIAAGASRSALVGGVDETTLPREFYTRRFDVAAEQMIGEGSGWLLLDAAPERNGIDARGAILGVRILPAPATPDSAGLIDQVRQFCKTFAHDAPTAFPVAVLPGTGITADDTRALQRELGSLLAQGVCHDYLGWSGHFPTAAAVGIAAMFAVNVEQLHETLTCLHVNRDSAGRTGLILFEVYPSLR